MSKTDLIELISSWDLENNGISPEESTLAARLEILTYRALAEGQPVSAAKLASMAGVDVDLIEAFFEIGRTIGAEWDEEGRLVGNVLTLNPTQHRFRVNGSDLYTWCSMDALHLPGLLGQLADVESIDPLSGQKIYLTVPPFEVPDYRLAGTVLSIVLSDGDRNGPESPLCQQMHFFASRENAELWVRDHPDATILTVKEVHQLVRHHIHAPLQSVLNELSNPVLREKAKSKGDLT